LLQKACEERWTAARPDQIDTNHDGKITKDKLDGYIGTMFQKYDKNGASGLSWVRGIGVRARSRTERQAP
jgi:hypothetical protein